jgi:hypothetical protein
MIIFICKMIILMIFISLLKEELTLLWISENVYSKHGLKDLILERLKSSFKRKEYVLLRQAKNVICLLSIKSFIKLLFTMIILKLIRN